MNRSFLGPREGFSLLLTQLITISGLDSSLPFLHPTWLFDSQTKCSSCSRLLPQMTSLSQASVLPASSLQVIDQRGCSSEGHPEAQRGVIACPLSQGSSVSASLLNQAIRLQSWALPTTQAPASSHHPPSPPTRQCQFAASGQEGWGW